MSLIEARMNQSSDDWGVVIQSVPTKSKKNIVKQLEQIFQLDKRDAEQVLANMPLILIDGISFGTAVRIKKYFQDLGAVSETTNHDMIKKNCFQVVWPQLPDLAFFMKDQSPLPQVSSPEVKPSSAKVAAASPAHGKSFFGRLMGASPAEKKPNPKKVVEAQPVANKPVSEKIQKDSVAAKEPEPEKIPEIPAVAKVPEFEKIEEVPPAAKTPAFEKPAEIPVFEDKPRVLEDVLSEELVSPLTDSAAPVIPDEKPVLPLPPAIDPSWERRVKELNEKLQRIQDEKQQIHEQHTEATEKVKSELAQKIEQEKQKSEELSRAFEDLQKKAEKNEELSKAGEEWRVQAVSLGEKMRELEADLASKSDSLAELMREKAEEHEELSKAGEEWRVQAVSLGEKMRELEAELARKSDALEELKREKDENAGALSLARESLAGVEEKLANVTRDLGEAQDREKELNRKTSEFEAARQETSREVTALRDREQELLKKIENFETNMQQHVDALRARDEMLSQFEKQVLDLAGKVSEFDAVRREHAQFVHERNDIRKEYEAKLSDQEVRLAKIEDEHRRYRSRTDRKNAAATRELGDSVRAVDSVRQVLQKLILFLGSEAAVLDTEKKITLKSPLTRGPSSANP